MPAWAASCSWERLLPLRSSRNRRPNRSLMSSFVIPEVQRLGDYKSTDNASQFFTSAYRCSTIHLVEADPWERTPVAQHRPLLWRRRPDAWVATGRLGDGGCRRIRRVRVSDVPPQLPRS